MIPVVADHMPVIGPDVAASSIMPASLLEDWESVAGLVGSETGVHVLEECALGHGRQTTGLRRIASAMHQNLVGRVTAAP